MLNDLRLWRFCLLFGGKAVDQNNQPRGFFENSQSRFRNGPERTRFKNVKRNFFDLIDRTTLANRIISKASARKKSFHLQNPEIRQPSNGEQWSDYRVSTWITGIRPFLLQLILTFRLILA